MIIKQFLFQMFLLLLTNPCRHHWLEKIPLSFHRFQIIQSQVLFKLITIPIIQTRILCCLFVHRIVSVNTNPSEELPFECCFFCTGDLSSTPLLMLDNPVANNPVVQEDPTTTTFLQRRSFPISSSSSSSVTSSQSQQVRMKNKKTKRLISCLFVFVAINRT